MPPCHSVVLPSLHQPKGPPRPPPKATPLPPKHTHTCTHEQNRTHNPTAPAPSRLLSTRVGGEKRFAAAVARRLQSLGALTRGDRRAASGVDLSESNFDSPLGRK